MKPSKFEPSNNTRRLASPSVQLHLLRAGWCRHLSCMAARGTGWHMIEFPALCGLIRHPQQGWVLYDTGYAEHFFDATQAFPERLYRSLLPVHLPAEDLLHHQLAGFGLSPQDISLVVVSHYHGDHIAGLRDFPKARFVALQADTDSIAALRGHRWRATVSAHLPALLPEDYFARVQAAEACPKRDLPAWMAPFATGFDLLGDGSLLGIPLPGHSAGQLGLLLPDAGGRPAWLIGDACWSLPALKAGQLPSRLTMFVTQDRRRFTDTFLNLGALARREPELAMLPSHCTSAWQHYRDTAGGER